MFKELNGGTYGKGVILHAKGNKNFLWKIWSIKKEHNGKAEWLEELKTEQNEKNMRELGIKLEMDKEHRLVLPNGKIMREIDETGCKYLSIVGMDKIKETDMKEKFAT